MSCLMNICKGQDYKYVYYFDNRLAAANKADAVIVGKGLIENGIFRLDYFGKEEGNLFMSAHYTDSTLAAFEGQFTRYYKNGKLREQGDYVNDQKNGFWQKWDTLGFKTDSIIYKDDAAVREVGFNHNKNGGLSYYSFKDSLADTYSTVSYDDKGVLSQEVFFKGQAGIMKTYDSLGKVKLDSLFTREEMEASFPGGTEGWITYLQKYLDPAIPVKRGAPVGAYQVFVRFIVTKDGSLSGISAETNFGFGMEKEVIRIIRQGPKWIPAIQYGRKVNAYRRQPVTFLVEMQ